VRLTREALDLVDDIFAWANARRAAELREAALAGHTWHDVLGKLF
jgi:hypothetical protein